MLKLTKSILCLSLLILLLTGACSALATPGSPPQAQPSKAITYDDPFEYCAAAITADVPGAQYTGTKMPDSIIEHMIAKGIVSADAPLEFQKHAVWRCMNAHVWVCHFGANLPCLEKANISKVPTTEIEDYCKTNPNIDSIPAAVTGRATVYEWKCNSGQPEVVRQVFQVDSQGYLANFWYEMVSQ
jgi:hypothetical protein